MRHRVKATVQLTHGDGFGVDDAVDHLHKRGTSSFRYMTVLTAFPKRNIFIGTFRYMTMFSTCPNRNIFIGTFRYMTAHSTC